MKISLKAVFTLLLLLLLRQGVTFGTVAGDFWENEPQALADRYHEAASRFNEEWVLAFADSLETLGNTTGKKPYLFHAAQLRCHNAFNNLDKDTFLKYSSQTCALADKLGYVDEFFSEMVNVVSFFINISQFDMGEQAARNILAEAKKHNYAMGNYFGHFALGTLYQAMGTYQKSIENYLHGLDYIDENELNLPRHTAQVYGLVAYAYLSMKEYDKVIEYSQMALEKNELEDDAYAYMALAYYYLEDYDKFRDTVEEYKLHEEKSTSISFVYYKTYLQAIESALDGDFEASKSYIDQFPDEPECSELLAEYYKHKGDWKLAYEYREKVINFDSFMDKAYHEDQVARMERDLSEANTYNKTVRNRATMLVAFCAMMALALVFFFNHRKDKKILKLKEQELEVANRYHALVENAPFGYSKAKMVFNPDGSVADYYTVEVNKVLRKAVKAAGAIIGDRSVLTAYPESGPILIEKINEARSQNLPYVRFSYNLVEFDRNYETIMLFDDTEFFQVISLNTTEVVKARQALEESNAQLVMAKERAEKSDSIKTQFIQNMSHEIRTPLNAIVGFSQLLSLPDGFISEQEKNQYSSYVKNNSDMLMMLIDDILDIADAENGNYRIVLDDASCNFICQSAIKTVEYRTPPGVVMTFTSEVDDSYMIKTDARRVQQVIINYLTNACKHTTSGEIHVGCSISENPGRVTFSVEDTGVGVPPEMADNIFERFTKLDVFKQGAGLGLNICTTIAEKLGGQVLLDTKYTGGARFLFIL